MNNGLTKVSEIIEEISMGPFGSDIKVDNFVESGVPVLNGANLPKFKLLEEEFRYVTVDKAKTFRKAIAKRGDIVITHRGTIGQISYIPENSKFEEYVISQSQFRVALNKKLVDPAFFVYYFHTNEGQKRLLANKCHVGVPALAQATTNFRLIEIPLPNIQSQLKIAAVLSALDSKIELNNRINAELESMAKTLYDFWFVQFDFPDKNGKPYKTSGGKMIWSEGLNREIPEGWEVGTLGDVAELVRGVTYGSDDIKSQSASDVIPILRATNISGNVIDLNNMVFVPKQNVSNAQLLNKYDILITMSSGSKEHIGKNGIFYYEREASFGAFCAKIVANAEYRYYLYSFTQSDFMFTTIKNECLGTNINNLNGSLVKGFKLIIPPNKLINSFKVKVNPVYEKIGNNLKENQKLTELRDWLLPMLMNGQVKVN